MVVNSFGYCSHIIRMVHSARHHLVVDMLSSLHDYYYFIVIHRAQKRCTTASIGRLGRLGGRRGSHMSLYFVESSRLVKTMWPAPSPIEQSLGALS
jgi:hypothetical protein